MTSLKHGDYTQLAAFYGDRPAYCPKLLQNIFTQVGCWPSQGKRLAEIGAGTGKMTKILCDLGFAVEAVEPNDEMRKVGMVYAQGDRVAWRAGSAENTGLPSQNFDGALMASSFHWTEPTRSLPEIHRVLKPKGFFTIVWNPRDVAASPLEQKIENIIAQKIPQMNRVSSGASHHTKDWTQVLESTGHFNQVFFQETNYQEIMTPQRYLNVWRSVNDVRVQAGEEAFAHIMSEIEGLIAGKQTITVFYKIRAWTAKAV